MYDPLESAQFVANYIQRYQAPKIHFAHPRPQEGNAAVWTPPVGDTIKIKFDESINKVPPFAGLGGVARDSSGRVLAWRRQRVDSSSFSFMFIRRSGNSVSHRTIQTCSNG